MLSDKSVPLLNQLPDLDVPVLRVFAHIILLRFASVSYMLTRFYGPIITGFSFPVKYIEVRTGYKFPL